MQEGNLPMRDFMGSSLKDKIILDIGCGDCSFMDMFEINKNTYFGLEFDDEKVKKAKEKGYNVKSYNLECGKLEYPDGYFDIVIAKDIFEHLNNFVNIAKECQRVLKKGGILFISVPSEWSQLIWDDYGHKRAFTIGALRDLLSKNGFFIEKIGKYRDLCKFKTSRLKYTMRYLFLILTGIDLITQGYFARAIKG